MRLFFILFVCFYMGGSSHASAATGIFQQLITTYFDGVARKDFQKLESVTTPDFVIYEFGKKWTNDSVFRNIQYHEPFGVTFTLTDFVAFADVNSGDATYHSQADFEFGDTDKIRLNFYETATFRKTPAGWKINMIQVSAVAPPEVNIPSSYLKYDTVRYFTQHYKERRALFASEDLAGGGGSGRAPSSGLAASSGRPPSSGRAASSDRAPAGPVVFFGNSITEFGDWKRLLRDSGVVNRGIAADNTFGMLDRLSEVIALKPKALYIEAGINDIGQLVPPALIAANIGSMVQYVRVKSPDTKVYVLSILPTNAHAQTDYPEIAGKNATARETDHLLAAQAMSRGYTYLDLATKVATSSGDLDERYAQPDGLHLNDAGYSQILLLIFSKKNEVPVFP